MGIKEATELIDINKSIYRKLDVTDTGNHIRVMICEAKGSMQAYMLEECCRDLGIPVLTLWINDGNQYAQKLDEYSFQKFLYDFRPTILLLRDKPARNWLFVLPPNLIVLTYADNPNLFWAKDRKAYLESLDAFNFLVYPFDMPEDCLNLSEDLKRHIIQVTSPAPGNLFTTMAVTEEEQNAFQSDIMIIGNKMSRSVMKRYFTNGVLRSAEHSHKAFYDKLIGYFDDLSQIIYEELKQGREILYSSADYDRLSGKLSDKYSLNKEAAFMQDPRLFRMLAYEEAKSLASGRAIAEWIIEGGYQVKLYGSGWFEEALTAPYSYGSISYAEELPIAYNCAKISVGINPVHLFHQRMIESLLCGCMYLVPPQDRSYCLSSLDPYFQDGRNIVCFSCKEELYSLLDYYLEHDTERREMAEKGRQTIIGNGLTSETIWRNILMTAVERAKAIAEERRNAK